MNEFRFQLWIAPPAHQRKATRNPEDHDDQWLVSKDYFEANFEAI